MRPKQTGRQNSKLNDPHHHDGDNKTEYLICIRLANVIRQNGSVLWRRPCPSRFYIWSAPCDTSFKARRIEISLLTYLLTYLLHGRPQEFLQERGKVYILPFLSVPSPVSPFFSFPPVHFPSALSTLQFLLLCYEADPLNTARSVRERCKLPQWSLGQSLGRNSNMGIF